MLCHQGCSEVPSCGSPSERVDFRDEGLKPPAMKPITRHETVAARLWAALLAAIILALPFTAQASIPPSYEVSVVAEDRREEAMSRALIEAMSAQDAFFWVRAKVSPWDLRQCLAVEDRDRCVRDLLNAGGISPHARPVVILAEVEDGIAQWRCLGSGRSRASPEVAAARIDLQAAIFGDGDTRIENLRFAMDCISFAARESSPG